MQIADVEFDCVRSAIYHGARMHFLDRLNRWMLFIVVLSSTATMANFIVTLGISSEIFSIIAATFAAANIAFGFSNRARDHDFLRRKYYELLAKLVEQHDQKDIAERVHCDMLRASAAEPPPLRALDAIAYNAALQGLGRDESERIPIRWWESLFRQMYPFNGTNFASRVVYQPKHG
jgi:hypothetical protein